MAATRDGIRAFADVQAQKHIALASDKSPFDTVSKHAMGRVAGHFQGEAGTTGTVEMRTQLKLGGKHPWDVPDPTPSYRRQVNGIMLGYQGHVPQARDKIGGPTHGRVPLFNSAPSARMHSQSQQARPDFALGFNDSPHTERGFGQARHPQTKGIDFIIIISSIQH